MGVTRATSNSLLKFFEGFVTSIEKHEYQEANMWLQCAVPFAKKMMNRTQGVTRTYMLQDGLEEKLMEYMDKDKAVFRRETSTSVISAAASVCAFAVAGTPLGYVSLSSAIV